MSGPDCRGKRFGPQRVIPALLARSCRVAWVCERQIIREGEYQTQTLCLFYAVIVVPKGPERSLVSFVWRFAQGLTGLNAEIVTPGQSLIGCCGQAQKETCVHL